MSYPYLKRSITDKSLVGQQPINEIMKDLLKSKIWKRHPDEKIEIHHFTDNEHYLKIVYMRYSKFLGIKLSHKIIKTNSLKEQVISYLKDFK